MSAPTARDIIEAIISRRISYNPFIFANVVVFGADPTGATDSTAAFIAAAASSNYVYIPPGTYALTAGSMVFTTGVRFVGASRGSVTITYTANADLFSWTGGGVGGGFTGATINGSTQSAGNAISVVSSHRTWFDDLSFNNSWDGMLIQDQNVAGIGQVWMNGGKGEYGLKYYGSSPGSANVLNIEKLIVGFGTNIVTSPIGFLIDGSAATVNADTVGVTKGSAGLVIQNTPNFTAGPAFVTILNMQSDFAYSYGVSIDGGTGAVATTTHKIGSLYAQGCVAGPGVTINSKARNIVLEPLQITGNFQQGIYTNGRYVKIVAPQVANNSKDGSAIWSGIQIGPNSIGTTVEGGLSGAFVGYAAENQAYGVWIEAGATKYSVIGTNLASNVTGQYLDDAGDTASLILPMNASANFPNKISGPVRSMGSGTNLTLQADGNSSVLIGNATNGTGFSAQASDASTVNFLKAFGHAAGANPVMAAVGADTDIGFELLPKGAGVIQIGGAGSYAANNAQTVTIANVGPGGAGINITKWLQIQDAGGVIRYIPCFS